MRKKLTRLCGAASGMVVYLFRTGKVKVGDNMLILEFRKDGKLTDPGGVAVSSSMPGMASIIADTESKPTDVPGQYEVKATFWTKGTWFSTVSFGDHQQASFPLRVE